MHITIITPSFNQLDHLKRCVASVADQVSNASGDDEPRVSIHHHVQDGGSMDGTVEYLSAVQALGQLQKVNGYSFHYESECDNGMYDAINKGLRHALEDSAHRVQGNSVTRQTRPNDQRPGNDEIVAWLNCDEQYLPCTLLKVAAFFRNHPAVEILFGGMLMLDELGQLLARRKAMPMRRVFLEASYLYNFSCAMFFRRSAWERLGGLNTAYRNAGDEELMRRAMNQGMPTMVLDDYLSTFVYTGNNLSSDSETAVQEHELLKQSGSRAIQLFRFPLNLLRLTEKWLRGGWVRRGRISYEIFAQQLDKRTRFECASPDFRWPGESRPYLLSHRLK